MQHEHIDSVKTYALVLIVLLSLTVLTTWVSFIDLGNFSVVAALVIAVTKMLLVSLFFMHLRYSTLLTRLVILGGLMWLAILLLLTQREDRHAEPFGAHGRGTGGPRGPDCGARQQPRLEILDGAANTGHRPPRDAGHSGLY